MHKKLYYHKTDGGAEYLTDRWARNPDGSKEGVFKNAKIIVRLDGDITKDAEITLADELFTPNGIVDFGTRIGLDWVQVFIAACKKNGRDLDSIPHGWKPADVVAEVFRMPNKEIARKETIEIVDQGCNEHKTANAGIEFPERSGGKLQ
jgi:hypothetical protein